MPIQKLNTHISPRSLSELYNGVVKFHRDPSKLAKMYPWADRFVCGMPLAPWQRPVVWDDEMQSRFVDSVWAGVDTGSYMVNEWYEFVDDNIEMLYLSGIVIDGQQRLTSVERYFKNEIPATAVDGSKLLWSEITILDQRSFGNKLFPRTEIHTNDEATLREAYDMRAFGGVRHAEDQRAVQNATAQRHQ
ncbi:DUF262 domain-containing protein [Acidithiobacillus sulfurivorans]|uniref:DUF262 domain-containing protein n=1 Tax=Acidithiobacillus sulfurivorans TaxID=1958756 RepID=A0ABS5ZYL3_9PROT|nr:DUF262 domain-containing protein [Acidithiobacillus sulfurivorans]MBU2760300.1 DUF262 domain-containing protein [Acidithiobacillus sulfurivorans]